MQVYVEVGGGGTVGGEERGGGEGHGNEWVGDLEMVSE